MVSKYGTKTIIISFRFKKLKTFSKFFKLWVLFLIQFGISVLNKNVTAIIYYKSLLNIEFSDYSSDF